MRPSDDTPGLPEARLIPIAGIGPGLGQVMEVPLQSEYGWQARPEGMQRPLSTWLPGTLAQVRELLVPCAASLAFSLTLLVMARNENSPLGIQAGVPARVVELIVPLLAAGVVAVAFFRPWIAYLLVLLLAPLWDAAQVNWEIGHVQIIPQTIFVLALFAGLGIARTNEWSAEEKSVGRDRGRLGGLVGLAGFACLGFLVLAVASTLISPNPGSSANVLQHGILEPMATGILLIMLGPSRRRLAQVAVVLGLSVALGSILNVAQSLPAEGSMSVLQAQRLLFSRLTYFNVGLFGGLLAMAVPLLLGALAARRYLGLTRGGVGLVVVALAACSIGLFLSFTKSAWLSTSIGALIFVVLFARTWHRRAAIVLVAGLVSTLVVPWPAFVLQVYSPAGSAYRGAMVAVVGEKRFDSWNPATTAGHNSLTERFLASVAAVHIAIDHPLLGIGLDQYGSEAPAYKLPGAKALLDSAHDFWPEVAAELGLPALALIALLFALALLALWRTYRAPPEEPIRILAAALMASLLGWLVAATTYDTDLYRYWRNMASDMVMISVITAAAFALLLVSRRSGSQAEGSAQAGDISAARHDWLRFPDRPRAQNPSLSRMGRIRRAALPRWETLFFASWDQRPSVRPPGGSLAGSKIGS